MARLRGSRPGWDYEITAGLLMELIIGPWEAGCTTPCGGPVPDPPPDDLLELAWEHEKAGIVARWDVLGKDAGRRPYAWWLVEKREPMPDGDMAEAIRLLELAEMEAGEIAAVRRRALESLHSIEASNRSEDLHCVTTTPGVGERMRARRDEDAERWRRVLEAVGAD